MSKTAYYKLVASKSFSRRLVGETRGRLVQYNYKYSIIIIHSSYLVGYNK